MRVNLVCMLILLHEMLIYRSISQYACRISHKIKARLTSNNTTTALRDPAITPMMNIPEIERQRAERIAHNKAVLRASGLPELVSRFQDLRPRRTIQKRSRLPITSESAAIRRSSRHTGKPAPNYRQLSASPPPRAAQRRRVSAIMPDAEDGTDQPAKTWTDICGQVGIGGSAIQRHPPLLNNEAVIAQLRSVLVACSQALLLKTFV